MGMPEPLAAAFEQIMSDAPAPEGVGEAATETTESTEPAAQTEGEATAEPGKDEKKPPKPKPTPEELTHYRKLQKREAQIERKSTELSERERRFEAGLKALEVRQQEFEAMLRDFVEGDADTKVKVLSKTHGGDLPTLMRRLSETVAGLDKPPSQADLLKLIEGMLDKKLEPIKTDKEKREAEEKARAAHDQRVQMDQQVRADLRAEMTDAGSWPLLHEMAKLAGEDAVASELWKTGIAMVKLGRDDPTTYRRYSKMTPETASTMIAKQYERFLRTHPQGQELVKKLREKQTTPGAGTRSSTPAESLSAGQASTPGTARRPLTVEERETHHQQYDPNKILQELGLVLPNH